MKYKTRREQIEAFAAEVTKGKTTLEDALKDACFVGAIEAREAALDVIGGPTVYFALQMVRSKPMRHLHDYQPIIDEALLDYFRSKPCCERCHGETRMRAEPHHLHSKGKAGENRLDVTINLISLCRQCHQMFHDGNIERTELERIVAEREGVLLPWLRAEINFLLRGVPHREQRTNSRQSPADIECDGRDAKRSGGNTLPSDVHSESSRDRSAGLAADKTGWRKLRCDPETGWRQL